MSTPPRPTGGEPATQRPGASDRTGGTRLVHRRIDPQLGEFALRPVQPQADAALLHTWLTHPKSAVWLMQDAALSDVVEEFTHIDGSEHQDAFLGLHRGEPSFLTERYDPARVELTGLYPHRPGDVGMHFLCAPTDAPLHGFTLAVITTVMELLFRDPATHRVVVEPDVRNTAVHALTRAVGFEEIEEIAKPEKQALLSICTRARFQDATGVTPA